MRKTNTSLIGERFGNLIVVDFHHINKHRGSCWLCECDCGNTIVVSRNHLITGNTLSCGCRKRGPEREDLTGRQFGRLTVVSFDHTDSYRNSYWLCECVCGNRTVVTRGGLTSGNTTSCGCYQVEGIRERATIHRLSGSPLYKVWQDIKTRCTNVNSAAYHRYGGRGIEMCDEWGDFENFRIWALETGYKPTLTIDRINNDDGYRPQNCRWVDWHTQGNNRANNHRVEYNGYNYTVAEWADLFDMNYNTLWARVNRNDMRDFEEYFSNST